MQFCLDRTMSGKSGCGGRILAQDVQRSCLSLKVAAVFTHPQCECVSVCVLGGIDRWIDVYRTYGARQCFSDEVRVTNTRA